MILDSSALVAIALAEPERDAFLAAIDDADGVAIGAPTLVESGIVLTGRNASAAAATVNDLLAALDTVVLEFGERHWREALLAWREFGRGRHPARLNFGDCLTYATAKVADEPLLAKGGDFTKTT